MQWMHTKLLACSKKKMMSNILQGKNSIKNYESLKETERKATNEAMAQSDPKSCKCTCSNVKDKNMGEIVSKILQATTQKSKTVIKV